ncbi:MAG: ABC transporter substrate-binding protein [Nigerium sp.]|nr:ABC transporter substrate-binding protein [Nigerium sp.]
MAYSRIGLAALAAATALGLAACSGAPATPSPSAPAAQTTVTVTDNNGDHTISVPPTSVVALDNRTFQTLYDWNVKLSAAPRALIPSTIGYATDESIPDIGTHGDPKLELIVAAEPDLIINGQRLTSQFDKIAADNPDAVQLLLDPRKGEPFDAELKRQITVLGKAFGKDAEAAALTQKFDESIKAVKGAYKTDDTVMAVIVSGGKIGYVAPTTGRTLGPLFDIFGFTPSLKQEGSEDHQGDDISVETIAASNPDWLLVMDRDAAIAAGEPDYKQASTVIEQSEALKNVPAVTKGQVVYMPADTYTNEGIQTYTTFFTELATAMAAAK